MNRVLFVLPVSGGSGGAHSVVQEVDAMRDLGVDARILINRQNHESFRRNYDRFDWVSDGGLEVFDGPADLSGLIAGQDVVVATTNTSVHSISEAMKHRRGGMNFKTGYYVQDYEPLFYEPDSMEHAMALMSFTMLRDCTYLSKTSWLAGMVRSSHGHEVSLVVPSIDHGLYRPHRRREGGRRLVTAMVRPSTPRRAPMRTLRVLGRLAAGEFGDVDVAAFGVSAEDLEERGLPCPPGVKLLGRLSQSEVAGLLRQADMFLDLSDYQAFGRTSAESMACGCMALAPALGAAPEFIRDGVSGFLVDTGDEEAIAAGIRRMLSLTEAERRSVRLAGLEAVAHFTPIRAAVSELRALGLA